MKRRRGLRRDHRGSLWQAGRAGLPWARDPVPDRRAHRRGLRPPGRTRGRAGRRMTGGGLLPVMAVNQRPGGGEHLPAHGGEHLPRWWWWAARWVGG